MLNFLEHMIEVFTFWNLILIHIFFYKKSPNKQTKQKAVIYNITYLLF